MNYTIALVCLLGIIIFPLITNGNPLSNSLADDETPNNDFGLPSWLVKNSINEFLNWLNEKLRNFLHETFGVNKTVRKTREIDNFSFENNCKDCNHRGFGKIALEFGSNMLDNFWGKIKNVIKQKLCTLFGGTIVE